MIEKIITAFPKIKEKPCFSIQKTNFGIRDDQDKQQEPSYIVSFEEESHFKVENPLAKEVHFITIDKCLWNDSDGKKCDFIVFDDISFLFVEIKNPKIARAGKHRRHAEEQLLATIEKFREKIHFEKYTIYAIIAFVKNNNPKLATGSQNLKAKWDNYNIILMECNNWKFE